MSSKINSANMYRVLDANDANTASIKELAKKAEISAAQKDFKAQPEKGGRVFSAVEVIEYKQRQSKRAEEKAAREAQAAHANIQATKYTHVAKDSSAANGAVKPQAVKKGKRGGSKGAKVYTKEETEAYLARQAARAASKARKLYTKEQTEAYLSRKATREAKGTSQVQTKEMKAAEFARQAARAENASKKLAEKAAYLGRKAHRAMMAVEKETSEQQKAYTGEREEKKAAYEARCARRADKAAYEQREAKRQEKNKKDWKLLCLRNRWCFNCGSPEHYTNDCPEPLYKGKYDPISFEELHGIERDPKKHD